MSSEIESCDSVSVKVNQLTLRKNMILGGLVGLVVGFVVGVLFGRRNTKKVEAALVVAKAEISKLSGGKLNA